jgi:hypothetical protein
VLHRQEYPFHAGAISKERAERPRRIGALASGGGFPDRHRRLPARRPSDRSWRQGNRAGAAGLLLALRSSMLPSLQLVLVLVCLLVTGCSSDSGTSSPSGTSGSGGAGSAGGGSGGGEDAQVGLDAGQVGTPARATLWVARTVSRRTDPHQTRWALGSLVILGDSIGSGGGQPPFTSMCCVRISKRSTAR